MWLRVIHALENHVHIQCQRVFDIILDEGKWQMYITTTDLNKLRLNRIFFILTRHSVPGTAFWSRIFSDHGRRSA